MHKSTKLNFFILILIVALAVLTNLPTTADELANRFAAPPDSAKPRTYWFHMSGNITKPGITADLEAMKEIGLGGTLFMNVSVALPTGLVETKDFMSPAWQDCFQHMLNESARLGLEFGSAVCDGWGNAGGPAIPPELAMQKLTWSELQVRGGKTVDLTKIPSPTSQLDYYRDIAVLAFPTPPDDLISPPLPKTNLNLARPTTGKAEIRFDFDSPITTSELTLTDAKDLGPFGNPTATISTSDDGTTWRELTTFFTSWRGHPQTDLTVAFNPVKARHWKVAFPSTSFFRTPQMRFAAAALSSRQRIHFWQAKTAFISHNEHGGGADRFYDTGPTNSPGITPTEIVVLTGKTQWTAPKGDWTVLRIGHTPTGAHNAPATKAGVGLECDKLNPRGVEAQLEAFVDKMRFAAKPAARKAYQYTWIDSWEVGPQNWTANFPAEFKARRGYDLTLWLPVLAGGRVVGSRDQSERFLWDFRRTIADLFVDYYWRRSMELAEKRGMQFRAESFGRQQFMYDPLNYARANHMPCGEFWVGGGPRVDCKVAATAAHLSGRQIAGAESFTAGRGQWLDDPWSLKTLGDRAFCLGVNQYYFHRYAHQPWTNLVPGMTFGPYGINFERTSTWWKPGKAWVEYLTRCQAVLQLGRFVADAFVVLDEGAPAYGGWRHELAIPLPAGYDYDFANLDALRESKVEGGMIMHKNGMRYRVLILSATGRATPALMREVLRLAEAGAAIAAPREFTHAHGLVADAEVTDLWRKVTATGRVVLAEKFDLVEKQFGLEPDFQHNAQAEVLWIHRTDDKGADWYFLSNQSDQSLDALCTFRVAGRQPELWDPSTGQVREAARFEEKNGHTTVQVPFDPRGSWFMVFRKPASPLALKPEAKKDAGQAASQLPVENPTVTNTFTLLLRAKPTEDIDLPEAASKGVTQSRKQNYALEARQGELMFGVGHLNMGLSVGRNGVVVWEHGARYRPARIVLNQHIDDWTHLAVVYRDRQPNLYVNGKLVAMAVKSAGVVHPGGPGPFKGEIAGLELISTALDETALAEKMVGSDVPKAQSLVWIEAERLIQDVEQPDPANLGNTWELSFQPGRGAPASLPLVRLMDLSRHADDGISHFSGTMTYRKTIRRPEVKNTGMETRFWLDLGAVGNLAEILVNQKNLGVLWKKPFRMDVTDALREGANEIEVRVSNLWVNRLIGDAEKMSTLGVAYNDRAGVISKWPEWVPKDAPPPDAPVTFATWRQWQGTEPLQPSGLIGPVTLLTIQKVPVK
jgi:hypothetical protein